ncbi:MAG: metallophosphoesterase family protein [Aureliella sp.]
MSSRLIAIGDIHGCSDALDAILNAIKPSSNDTIVTLGDYVNRGPDSRGTIERLIELGNRCTLVPLLGNHDQMVLQNRSARSIDPYQLADDTYSEQDLFDSTHFSFLSSCRLFFETEEHFFVYANYDAKKDLSDQDTYTLLWRSLATHMPARHRSRKTAILGHTSQKDGKVLKKRHLVCIDTYCHGGGWLTAFDVHSRAIWQVDKTGTKRNSFAQDRG